MKKPRQELKSRFRNGMYPDEDDFANWLDSFWHKDDPIDAEKVEQILGEERRSILNLIGANSTAISNISLDLQWAEL